MKKIIAHAVSMLAFAAMLTAASYSQTILTADVPFAFNVGRTALPAGTYRVATLSPSIVNLRSADGSHVVSVISQPSGPGFAGSNPKLRFTIQDGEYVLTEIRAAGAVSGLLLPQTKHAKSDPGKQPQACKTMAANSLPNSGK